MKSNQSIRMLTAILAMLAGMAAHAADGYGGAWPHSNPPGAVSGGAGGYANYIADTNYDLSDGPGNYLTDEFTVEPPPPPGGFSGYLHDRPGGHAGGKGKACTTGSCGLGFGQDPFGPDAWGVLRLWGQVDYMMTWTKGRHLPPLVTTGNQAGRGRLGEPGTEILFGGEAVGEDIRTGGRFGLGVWLDPCQNIGIGGRFFLTENDWVPFSDSSQNTPMLARPFFDTNPLEDTQSVLRVADPWRVPVLEGRVDATATNEVHNLDAYFRLGLYQCGERRLDLLTGYQYSEIRDGLAIRHRSVDAFSQFIFEDEFRAENTFHGAAVGLSGEYEQGPLTLQLMSKIGFGNMRQRVRIAGQSVVDDFDGGSSTFDGGLLALGSNLGTHTDAAFAVAPEAKVRLSYQVTPHWDVALGYSLLYWTNVALAGDQIETGPLGAPLVNSTQLWDGDLDGPDNPSLPRIRDGGFWAQGMTFGVTFQH